ncbi:MAG: TatD family hydrolase [Anaerolineae bacterium]
MIDTHVHLQDSRYEEDLDLVLRRAADAGVISCIVPGIDLETSREAVALAEKYATAPCAIYAAVGYHPTNGDELTPRTLESLRELAQRPRVVAIGEIGLDYYWPSRANRTWHCAEPPVQREALQHQLALAAELGLPVIIHDRDAHDDTLAILQSWVGGGEERHGVLHAYAAGPDRLEEALALGFFVSIGGPVTRPKNSDLHTVARTVPLDRLLLETDGPYLTPIPHRGQRNEPSYLTYIKAQIARLRDGNTEVIARATTTNAQRLFGLA